MVFSQSISLYHLSTLLLFIIFTASCNTEHRINKICANSDITYDEKVYKYSKLKFLTNLQEASECSIKSDKPLFIFFCERNVFSTSSEQDRFFNANLAFINNNIRNEIIDNFIPLILYLDDRTKIEDSLIEFYIELINYYRKKFIDLGYIISNKFSQNSRLGNYNSRLEVAMCNMNSAPLVVILEPKMRKIKCLELYYNGKMNLNIFDLKN